MGVIATFAGFAGAVRERLWVLETEPAFSLRDRNARFIWPPYLAELEPLDTANARLALSSHGQLIRTIELPMTDAGATLASDGIIAVFEPDAE
jgi:hypothetical protein